MKRRALQRLLLKTTYGILCLLSMGCSTAIANEVPRVYLEVLTAKGVALDVPQRWLRTLQDVPLASLRMRQQRRGEQADIREEGGPASKRIYVQGLLRADGVLQVPGQNFRMSDRRRIEQWIKDLEAGNSDSAPSQQLFGMSLPQLETTIRRLSPTIRISTKGERLKTLVDHVQTATGIPIKVAAGVSTITRGDPMIRDELSGVSCGTGLAAALRPLNLALAPSTDGSGSLTLNIINARTAKEQWPVGWETNAPDRDSIPKLFEKLPVEIVDTPLADVLNVLQTRLKVPFLIDHRSLNAARISLTETKVKFPAKQTFYKRVLDRVLFQARLKMEIKLDEADRPIVWVTPS